MLEHYKRFLKARGNWNGDAINTNSIQLMNATFKNDPAYRIATINNEKIEIKYFVSQKYSIAKDQVDYLIQFRPGVHYPIGTYIDIPDDVGDYHTWLIVGRNNEPLFVKYNILMCNWTFKWIYKGKVHSCLGVIRSRNSYNSGVWTDYMVTSIENQISFWLPTNDSTNTIDYDQRFLICMNKEYPIAWSVTKREDVIPIGITKFTLKQDKYNPMEDNPDLMIANYYSTTLPPEELPETAVEKSVIISYSGSMPNIKCGGSAKTFTATFYNSQKEELLDEVCNWDVEIADKYRDYLDIQVQDNQLKLKCKDFYEVIGEPITIHVSNKDNSCEDILKLEVISL